MDENVALHLFTFNIHAYTKNCHTYTVQSLPKFQLCFCIFLHTASKILEANVQLVPWLSGDTDGVKCIKIYTYLQIKIIHKWKLLV